MPQEPSSRPPTPILDKSPGPIWMQDFYPVLGWGLGHPYRENTTLPNTLTGIKIDFPFLAAA